MSTSVYASIMGHHGNWIVDIRCEWRLMALNGDHCAVSIKCLITDFIGWEATNLWKKKNKSKLWIVFRVSEDCTHRRIVLRTKRIAFPKERISFCCWPNKTLGPDSLSVFEVTHLIWINLLDELQAIMLFGRPNEFSGWIPGWQPVAGEQSARSVMRSDTNCLLLDARYKQVSHTVRRFAW